ncbi:hypothetical protein CLAFUW4_14204 [Fulvia fulva]|uniref:Uncharacterized protein n=1 Tax=Passalora fulva TaxID=5499 RepID=A0A9Q8UWB4_PASFU|nr:uncharacterized protein CLAFUR5_14037 [Fulvia fulva]KAK4610110.1 hypothetical protein CLAFUR4_14207 [Fulvia fulva]KAK4610837.1 hypothetical protein CLAFUR0_14212 [Fulvia fulva]UJO24732.1 hypothetical protein CLAFUR5_14037 [Fulvia fulva]WPV21727.1 hypothetical protein CLAFUW4_14204 [Fulvia fulva]WPV36962.1 hypothetical protein CLAFUW7_14215 [Fulvia fulva]
MVQYRESNIKTYPAPANDYWKLSHPTGSREDHKRRLAKDGLYTLPSSDTKRLLVLIERQTLGFSTHRIKRFATNRKLDTSQIPKKPESINRSALIALLEQADKSITFSKILNLLPVLRLRVSEHHYDSFGCRCLGTPVPPPITQVCSLIRQEVLPLFFSAKRFLFRAQTSPRMERTVAPASAIALAGVELGGETETFLRSMPDEWWSMLHRVRICLTGSIASRIDINIGKNESPNTFDFDARVSEHFARKGPYQESVAKLERRFGEIMAELDSKEIGQTFGKEETLRFMRTLQESIEAGGKAQVA